MGELSFPVLLGCLGLGMVLLALEVFVTPGLGIKGTLGLGLLAFAVILAFTQHGPEKGLAALAIATAILLAAAYVAKITMGRRLVLKAELSDDDTPEVPADLLGQRGIALSTLRPSGIARIGDLRLDVTADNDFVDAGATVEVIAIEGNRVTVRERS